MPGRKAQLPQPFGIERTIPLMDEAGVDRVIIVPPSWTGDRNDYGLEAARAAIPDRLADDGPTSADKPESTALLPKWKKQPGMLGLRVTFLRDMEGNCLIRLSPDEFWPEAENTIYR